MPGPTPHPPHSFTTRALIALSRTLVHEPPGRLIGLVGTERRPVCEPCALPADPDLLLGFSAPEHWHGLAVVMCGSALGLADHLHIAYLLDRAGHDAITIANASGAIIATSSNVASGYVADVLRRVLGVACRPESRTVPDWAMAQWLTRVLDLAADPATSHQTATWHGAATLHPAFDPTLGWAPRDLAEATLHACRHLGWSSLRRQTAEGTVFIESVSPDLARWMDDAFFARWLLEAHRDPDELLDDLSLFLDDSTLLSVLTTVEYTVRPSSSSERW